MTTFQFIPISQRKMYQTAFDAITQLELWQYMRNFDQESFTFCLDTEVIRISKKISELGYDGHSGTSFGCTMRAMQYIAKEGMDNFKTMYRRGNSAS
jgi:hypothetical protein